MTRLIIALSFIPILSTQAAEIILPSVYADHMVIQTDQPIVLSGFSSGVLGELVIELAEQRATVRHKPFGSWTVTFDPVVAPGGSHALTFTFEGDVIHSVNNITFGDVWVCSGQSNMEWEMTQINDSASEIDGAEFPNIRIMAVSLQLAGAPLRDVKRLDQEWTPCSPESIRRFSAVGYFFGRELHQETGRPIGLIQSAWGGTPIETWIPDTALQQNPYFENVARHNVAPSQRYNAMIHGLAPLAIKGAIWYQGENNASWPQEYRSWQETLITSWRDLWNNPEMPFYFVQLANYRPGARWELLREAQTQTLAVPHTGMAVTIDIGDSTDIHPRNKQDVGRRLAAIALAKDYRQAHRVYSGPTFKSASTDGHNITLHFDHVGSGLIGIDGGAKAKGFEARYALGNWKSVTAKIVGNTIEIPGNLFDKAPQAVRYGWDSDPEVTLANKEGFPAVPFRFEALEELTYSSWKDQLVGTARLPDEDANGDGSSNLWQYASAEKPPSVAKLANGTHILTFHRRATAIDIHVSLEQSSDLEAWTETWSNDQPDTNSLAWTQENDWGATMTDRYTVTIPATTEPAAYYRVRYRLK